MPAIVAALVKVLLPVQWGAVFKTFCDESEEQDDSETYWSTVLYRLQEIFAIGSQRQWE